MVRIHPLHQKVNMSKRVIINTESVNRSGYRILNAGGKLDAYRANPVLLYNHDRYSRLPIGRLEDLKMEGGKMTALPSFDMKDPFAAEIARKWEANILNTASMGINVLSVSEDPKDLVAGQSRHTVTGWELLEVSIVDIPRNQDCVKLSLGQEDKEAAVDEVVPLLQSAPKTTTLNHSTQHKMDIQKIAVSLQLSASATEADVLAAIEKLKSGRTQALLALGMQNGVVTEANKKTYEALAAADYDNTLALLSAEQVTKPEAGKPATEKGEGAKADQPVTVEALLKAVQGANGATGRADDPNDKSKWTFDDYQKKDPDGLLKLKQENPAKYKELATAYKG
jgi:hypothetical protein